MKYKIIAVSFTVLALFTFCYATKAEDGGKTADIKTQAKSYMDIGAESAGLKEKDKPAKSLGLFIAEITKDYMGALGIALVMLIVIAGFMLITAQGDEEKVKTAHKIIEGAVIGLLIALSAYGIAYFVGKKAVEVTSYGVSYLDNNRV